MEPSVPSTAVVSSVGYFCFVFYFLSQTQIQNTKDLNMGFDCSAGDFKSAAATMDDLANIIQDVGIDNLKNQLGIDLDFAVLGQY